MPGQGVQGAGLVQALRRSHNSCVRDDIWLKFLAHFADPPINGLSARRTAGLGANWSWVERRPKDRSNKVGTGKLALQSQLGTRQTRVFMDARRRPRYKLEVSIRVYPRNANVVRGQTVDISESGISVMLRVEIPMGELVRLEFELPDGPVEAHAMVRQRNAFRYGLQFIDSGSVHTAVARTCARLAMEYSLRESKLS
jgi:hypothetical protein